MHLRCIFCNILQFLGIFLKSTSRSSAYKNGAPLESCNTMMPLHGARPNRGSQPYFLRIYDQEGNPVTEYKPGDKRALRVEIHGGKFRGFLMQARCLAIPGRRVGKFINPLPRNEFPVTKEGLSLWWRPPEYNLGPVQVIASVVQSKEIFWTWVTSPTIYPYSANLTVDTSRCGRGFGCFQLGAPGCRSSSSCDFTFSWKCTPDTVIFEFLGKQSQFPKRSQNYAGLGYSMERRLDDTEVVACMFKEESTPTLSTFYNRRRSTKGRRRFVDQTELVPLKMGRDKNRFFCRFERKQRSRQRRRERRGFHFFVHKTGHYSEKNVVPFRETEGFRLCSHPDLFVEIPSGAPKSWNLSTAFIMICAIICT